ncbi:MAG: hypothetical protein ACE5HX_06215 [bacterium]
MFEQIRARLIEFRKDFTLTSNHDPATSILNVLKSFGLTYRPVADAGFSVEIPGNASSTNVIAVRFEISECLKHTDTETSLNSKLAQEATCVEHILQSSVGLGVTRVLSLMHKEIKGKIRVIFQIKDNAAPSNTSLLIQQGVLNQVATIYALQSNASIPVDSVGIKFGAILASKDTFTLKLYRKNGYASSPSNAQNIIQIAANVIIALNHATTRKMDPLQPVAISISSIHSTPDLSDIADSVILKGTFQAMNESITEQMFDLVENTVQGITSAYNAEFQLNIEKHRPLLKTDQISTLNLLAAAEEALGEDHVIRLDYPTTGLEGLSEYLNVVPGTILLLGTGIDYSKPFYPDFQVLESIDRAIEIGVKTLSWALLKHLTQIRKT